MSDDHEHDDRLGGPRQPRLRDLARRIFREIDPDLNRDLEREDDDARTEPPADGHPPSEGVEGASERSSKSAGRGDRERGRADPWALLGALLETGDKAKTEMVRMTAREVRNYLEALELHKDLHHLLTNYSLEVSASFHLQPLSDPPPPPSAKAALRPKAAEPDAPTVDDDPPSRS